MSKQPQFLKHSIFVLLLLCIHLQSNAQDISRQHSFAKSYFGLDFIATPSYGESAFLNENGATETFTRNAFLTPAVNIGATHFWGHADLYVSITTAGIKAKKEAVTNGIDFGVFTGLRVYPWAINDNNFRPYVGYKFSPFRFQQEDIDGAAYRKTDIKSVFEVGVGYRLPNFYFFLGYNNVAASDTEIHLSRTTTTQTTFPKHFVNLGLNWMIESTASAQSPITQHFSDIFSQSNKDGLFFGIGPSAAFPILKSTYVEDLYPFLDNLSMPTTFPDIALGYHFTKQDLITALSFRPMVQRRKALDFEQKIRRNSLVLECYKFIGDYHGFVPFIGTGLSYENLTLTEQDEGVMITNINENKLTGLIVFGWDIRPGKKGDWWLLRTNLRYAPSLKLEHLDKVLSLQHLEFNFIQFVCYPQRLKKYKQGK